MKKSVFVVYFILVFVLGWVGHAIYATNFISFAKAFPTPYKALEGSSGADISFYQTPSQSNSDSFIARMLNADNERYSPNDRIRESQIHVYKDKIIIDLKDASWSSFVDTNSMDPVFDYGTNGFEVMPDTSDDIRIGDIISYEYEDTIIAHRVVDIGEDKQGIYFITKGDNNIIKDPDKVRFWQVKGVLVGLIY